MGPATTVGTLPEQIRTSTLEAETDLHAKGKVLSLYYSNAQNTDNRDPMEKFLKYFPELL